MMTTEKLAELYKTVLRLEEKLELIKARADQIPKTDPAWQKGRNQVAKAREELTAAQSVFSNAIHSYNKSHRNIPFFRRTKTFSVKLETKTVKFYFDQHGLPTIV